MLCTNVFCWAQEGSFSARLTWVDSPGYLELDGLSLTHMSGVSAGHWLGHVSPAGYSGLLHVPLFPKSRRREGVNPSAQAPFTPMLTLCLLVSHWPKKITCVSVKSM